MCYRRTLSLSLLITIMTLTNSNTISSFKNTLQKEFINNGIYMVQPRGIYDRPRLGSTSCAGPLGAVY